MRRVYIWFAGPSSRWSRACYSLALALSTNSSASVGGRPLSYGFPQEYSPDGRDPRIYSYDYIEASFGFQRLPGSYTRYGDVRELLGDFDDRYVVMATGDEIALEYDATALPAPAEGMTRTWVLVSHAWCKDMDIHSVGPGTVEPLPFAGMSGYPYPAGESFPWGDDTRAWQERYNTRVIR